MANVSYQKVGDVSGEEFGPTTYLKYSEMAPNTVIEGTFNGSHMGNFDKLTYFIKQEDGSTIGLNESGKLKYLLNKADVQVGMPVRITYLGKSVVAKGANAGKQAHDFTLEVAQA